MSDTDRSGPGQAAPANTLTPTVPEMWPDMVLDAAVAWRDCGYYVRPVVLTGEERPITPCEQSAYPTYDDVLRAFGDDYPGVGLFLGSASKGLEVLELTDGADATARVLPALKAAGLEGVWDGLGQQGYTESTPTGGLRLLYRMAADWAESATIAERPARDDELTDEERARRAGEADVVITRVLARTRGEGEFVVVAPSHGPVHPSGRPWVVLGDSEPGYTGIVTAEQRQALHSVIRAVLDEMPLGELAENGDETESDRDWARQTSWPELIRNHGDQLVYSHDGWDYWLGLSEGGIGISFRTGGPADALVNFSPSLPFPVGKYISKLEARACIENEREVDVKRARTEKSVAQGSMGGSLFLKDGSLLVGSPARLAEWLRLELGRNALAGVFLRGGDLVYTPAVGEQGYVPAQGRDDDGPAQVRTLDASRLASRCQYTYRCVKVTEDRETRKKTVVPGMFPVTAAKIPVDVPDMLRNVRHLRGVVHAPALRPGGSIIETPGYDAATGLLYLPEPGLVVPPVPAEPTEVDVKAAVALLDEMLAGFVFAGDGDRGNYLGLLLTPLLRTLLPPPYKMGCIGAPMPGSGKSLLASILRVVHGGVFRAEVPGDESELRKQVSTILDVTTGPVVQFDNVTGVLRSSTLAGLLTSPLWDDRLLGTNRMIKATNDRLWVVTGNNLALGGDLVRRAVWVTIDPGVPDPHLRTGFRIADLEGWVRRRRGDILRALLVLTRSWIAAGSPKTLGRSDSYAGWAASLAGLLSHAGIPGGFDAPTTARQTIGTDDSEWADFLRAIHEVFGAATWHAGDVIGRIPRAGHLADGTPAAYANTTSQRAISSDSLPTELADKFDFQKSITKSLGRWLANREGRWAGGYVVKSAGEDRAGRKWWVDRWEAA